MEIPHAHHNERESRDSVMSLITVTKAEEKIFLCNDHKHSSFFVSHNQ